MTAAFFEERQRFLRRGLGAGLLAVLVAVSLAAWVEFREGLPGTRQLLLLLPTAVVGLLIFTELHVTVTPEAVRVRMRPFVNRTIARTNIAGAEARTYRPVREYGGWGVRLGRRGWAYNVSGNRGVLLTLVEGRRVMIGSQRAGDLAAAVRAMTG